MHQDLYLRSRPRFIDCSETDTTNCFIHIQQATKTSRSSKRQESGAQWSMNRPASRPYKYITHIIVSRIDLDLV